MKALKINNRGADSLTGIVSIVLVLMTIFVVFMVGSNMLTKVQEYEGAANGIELPGSFIIFQDENNFTMAKNCNSSRIDFKSTDAASVFQDTIEAVGNASGGSIYIKLATYWILESLNITKSNITITADPGTVIKSPVMPVLSIWGNDSYGDDFDPYHNRLYNIHISNIQFFYTGEVNVTGAFVRIYRANLGAMVVPGGMTLENLVIQGNAGTFSTNDHYIGLQVRDSCGDIFTDVSVAWWGTGIEIGTTWDDDYGTWYPSDGNTYIRIHVGACANGIYYRGAGGGQAWQEYWLNLKVFACSDNGLMGAINTLTLELPHFESMSGYARPGVPQSMVNLSESGDGILTINNGEFQGVIDYGIKLSAMKATISNCFFAVHDTAILLWYCNVVLINNQYSMFAAAPPEHKVENHGSGITAIADGYKMSASGIGETNGASYFQTTHGMDTIPYFATLNTNCSSSTYGGWHFTSDDTYITFYFDNPGYYYCFWSASSTG